MTEPRQYRFGEAVTVEPATLWADGYAGRWYVCRHSRDDLLLSRGVPTDSDDWEVSIHLQRVRGSGWNTERNKANEVLRDE